MLTRVDTSREQLADSLRALRGAFGNPAVRRIELAYAGSVVGHYAGLIAIAVYAFDHGGTTAVGVFMFVRLGAAALVAPFTATLADRYPQERVMLAADLVRVALVSTLAVAAATGTTPVVYVLATLVTMAGTAFNPAEASLLPLVAASPEELTAANVSAGTLESVAAFAGPAVAALLMAVAGTSAAFAFVAATYAWSGWFVAGVRRPQQAGPATDEAHAPPGIAAGFRAVRHEPRLQLLIGLNTAETVVIGAYSVLVVVIALQLLSLGSAGVGLLETATGIGAFAGALLAFALVGRGRTAADLALGLALFGGPLIAIGVLPRTWLVVVALAVYGAGYSVVGVSTETLLQRAVPTAAAGRVFGLVQSMVLAGLAVGSLAVPLLVHLIGARATLVAVGAMLPAIALVTRRSLVHIDHGAQIPEGQLAAIGSVAFLGVLPLLRREELAASLQRHDLDVGATLFRRGDRGDRFYIVAEGAVEIDLTDGPKRETAPCFVGEIALLRNVPRTATVRVVAPSVLWSLEREPFLAAVTGHGRSRASADQVLATRDP